MICYADLFYEQNLIRPYESWFKLWPSLEFWSTNWQLAAAIAMTIRQMKNRKSEQIQDAVPYPGDNNQEAVFHERGAQNMDDD